MNTLAVVLEEPEKLVVSRLDLSCPGDEDVVVDIEWSGISTGTERLLWSGRMPQFPGMGYPLVPGYESVGRVTAVGAKAHAGVGPVPVSVAEGLLGRSVLQLVITRGVDVLNVTHLGRGPTAAQKIALAWASYDPEAAQRAEHAIVHGERVPA